MWNNKTLDLLERTVDLINESTKLTDQATNEELKELFRRYNHSDWFNNIDFLYVPNTKNANITTTPEQVKIQLAIPGKKFDNNKDLSVKVVKNTLTVNYTDNANVFCKPFKSEWQLPANSIVHEIDSCYMYGVLTIVVPRNTEKESEEVDVRIRY